MRRRLTALAAAFLMAVTPVGSAAAEDLIIDESVWESRQETVNDFVPQGGDALQIEGLQELSQGAEPMSGAADEALLSGAAVSDEVPTDEGQSAGAAVNDPAVSDEALTDEGQSGDVAVDDPAVLDETLMDEGQSGDVAVPEADGEFVVGIEEADASEVPGESECAELLQTVEGQLEESGYASCATLPRMRTYFAATYNGSYGAQLSGNAKVVYDAMKRAYVDSRAGVPDGSELRIPFASPLTFSDEAGLEAAGNTIRSIMQSAFDAFVYDYPEVFWMDAPGYSYGYTSGTYPSSVAAVKLKPKMIYPGAGMEVGAFDSALAAAYAEAVRGAAATPFGRVAAIHAYLCRLLMYSEGTTEKDRAYAHSAAGVFLSSTKKVVCEGYAKAFKLLCKKANLESALIVGNAGGPHMWNYVRMDDGNWYLVDVTWDDGRYDTFDTTYLLAGSTSLGISPGVTIASERTLSNNFSGSSYTVNFAYPVLNPVAYGENTESGHRHSWQTQEIKPTCVIEGRVVSRCACGAETVQYLEPLGHCFDQEIYVYNGDATCTENGTKSLVCDYGCGSRANSANAPGIPDWMYTVEAEGTALGHRFVTYTSNHDASWNKDGTKTSVCANGCGAKKTVTDKGSARIPTISLNAKSITLKKGQSTRALKVSRLASGDRIKNWKSSNTKIVKVSSSGKLTAQKRTGKAKVTVTLASGLSKSVTVKVQSGTVRTTKISGVAKKLTLRYGKKAVLKPVISPITSREKITYSSSDKKVATVSSKGVITAKGSGKARITVKSGRKKVTVTVTVPTVKATKISGVPKTLTLKRGKTKTLKVKLYPAASKSRISYSSSKKSVVSVSSKGKLTARKKGKAVITIKAGSVVVKCTVRVK